MTKAVIITTDDWDRVLALIGMVDTMARMRIRTAIDADAALEDLLELWTNIGQLGPIRPIGRVEIDA